MSTMSVQFPLLLKNASNQRFGHWGGQAAATAKTRDYVAMILRTQFDRPPTIVGALPNRYDITLERMSSGVLDSDGLESAFKGVRDLVASWLLTGTFDVRRMGRHDDDPCFRWIYRQWRCERGAWAVRITIEDDSDQPDRRRVLGDAPKRLTEVLPNERRGRALRRTASRIAS